MVPTRLMRVLETALYVQDLDAAERFYDGVLGLERIARVDGRHVFFRCGEAVVLLFDPRATGSPSSDEDGAVPSHGATGAGHVAFAVKDADIAAWRTYLESHGIAIESEVTWPRGGRSIYVRDPAGNSVELASPLLWGFHE